MIAIREQSATRSVAALADRSAKRVARGEPAVTVVIPVFNQWRVTARCLKALFACDSEVAIQTIVVDDGSTDETLAQLSLLPGIEVVRNGQNRGFVHSCNRGAALARADLLMFLNNDTELAYGAIRALVRRMARSADVGIVGSKLVYPNGRLQEAGGIIWSDATGWNYGRLDDPGKSEYNFARDVDYVSGASLLIRTELFRRLDGFDTRFSPGYYEDADLCFAVRALGKRVVYEPASIVTHHEGVTSGTDLAAGMKRFQTVNQAKFQSKWSLQLDREHLGAHPRNVCRAARIRGGRPRVLIIDSYVPLYDKEAGSNRLKRLISGMRDAGLQIVFLPDNLSLLAPYTQQLQSDGVEVIYHAADQRRPWQDLLTEILPTVDIAWICRPDLVQKYLPTVRKNSTIPVVYDTIDLHYLRLRRQAETELADDTLDWRKMERLELACAKASDRTVVVSDYEAKLLEAAGIPGVGVVSTIHDFELSGTLGYDKTSGIVFIGGYNHLPNVDAAAWLIRDIMPLVWAMLPNVVVTLLGANPTNAVRDLAGESVIVPGFINDHEVAKYFQAARVFVAPLRYGAGLKGKVGQALAFATPIVSTSVGVEGFHLKDGVSALVADDPEQFAAAIVRLYGDPELWAHLSSASAGALEPFGSRGVLRNALEVIDAALDGKLQHQTKEGERMAERSGRETAPAADGLQTESTGGTEPYVALQREALLFLEHENLTKELEHRARVIFTLESHCARYNLEIERLHTAVRNRDSDYAMLLTTISTLRSMVNASIFRATEAERRLQGVVTSKSWQIIASLRFVAKAIRRVSRMFARR